MGCLLLSMFSFRFLLFFAQMARLGQRNWHLGALLLVKSACNTWILWLGRFSKLFDLVCSRLRNHRSAFFCSVGGPVCRHRQVPVSFGECHKSAWIPRRYGLVYSCYVMRKWAWHHGQLEMEWVKNWIGDEVKMMIDEAFDRFRHSKLDSEFKCT